MNKKLWYLILPIAALLGWYILMPTTYHDKTETISIGNSQLFGQEVKLRITDLNIEDYRILGTVINESDRSYSSVELVFTTISEQGESKITTKILDLAPGRSLQFKSDPILSKTEVYRLSDIFASE